MTYSVGTFQQKGAGTGTQNIAHGLGVTPKAVLIWTTGQTATGISTALDMATSIGITDGTNHRYLACQSDDAAGTSQADRACGVGLILILSVTRTTLAEATLSSLDSTNIVLNWTTNDAVARQFNFLAIAGASVNAKVKEWNPVSSTGDLGITGVGFKPTVVLHLGLRTINNFGSLPGLPYSTGDAFLAFGCMDKNGHQWANAVEIDDAAGTSNTKRYQRTNACIALFHSSLGTIDMEASFVSMDTDGFTINVSNAPGQECYFFSLCLNGVEAYAGNTTKPTGAAPASHAITAPGWLPQAVLFSTVMDTAQTTVQDHARFGIGAADGTHEVWSGFSDSDNEGTELVDVSHSTTKVLVKHNNNAGTLNAEADLASLDSGGFTLSWSTNDAVATEILYLALRDSNIIACTGIASSVAFGTQKVNLSIAPSGIASSVAFGTLKVNLFIVCTGIPTNVLFGSAIVAVGGTEQFIQPSGIASSVAFGTQQLNLFIVCAGIPTSVSFGTLKVNLWILPSGIASSVAFGALLIGETKIYPSGIASSVAFGTARILPNYIFPTDLVYTVGGVAVKILADSLEVENVIDERSVLHLTVVDDDGNLTITKGTPIIIRNGAAGEILFAGFVDEVERIQPGINDPLIFHNIGAVDYHYLADKRLVAQSYVNQTAGAIVADLHSIYLADEGVALGDIADGPVILETVLGYVPVSQALQVLAEKSDYWWRIDEDGRLQFGPKQLKSAPFEGTGAIMHEGSISVNRYAPRYRNRQYLTGVKQLTSEQVESHKGDGAARAFAVSYPIQQVPTVTVNAGAQTVGIKGIDTGKDWYWSKGDAILAQDSSGALLTSSDTLEITYIGEFDAVIITEDPAAIAAMAAIEETGTGQVEAVEQSPDSDTPEAAFQTAGAMLARYGVIGTRVRFTTRRHGLQPGQLITITLPEHGLDELECLIEKVNIRDRSLAALIYEVSAVDGPEEGSWARSFRQALGIVDLINVGTSSNLTIVAGTSESWDWTETSVTETVYACTAVDTGVQPSGSLYPC